MHTPERREPAPLAPRVRKPAFMNSGDRRAAGLDGLRGLAAAAVVLLHVWMFSGAHQPWQGERTDEIVGSMGLALMLFFVLSGLLIATPWVRASAPGKARPRLRPYALRRATRIVPAYAVCVLGSYVLMRAIDHPLAIEAKELPNFLLFANNQFDATAGQLNPPLWSLGIEASFYLAMPVLGAALIVALRRSGPGAALTLCAAIAAAGLAWNAWTFDRGEPATLVAFLPTYLPIFACGIAAAVLVQRYEAGRSARAALVVAGSVLVVANGWWHADGTGWLGHVVRDVPAGVGFAMVAGAVAQGPGWILGSAPLRRLGDFSFGIYLWHMPVLYLVRHQDRWPLSPWEAYALVLGISTVLGAISWYALERPATNWAARKTKRRPTEQPTPQPVALTRPVVAAER